MYLWYEHLRLCWWFHTYALLVKIYLVDQLPYVSEQHFKHLGLMS